MTTQNKNVPALRFPEFNEEWGSKSLGEISKDVMYGLNSSAIKFDGTNKYIRITDIDEDSREFIPKPLTSPDGKLEARYKLKEGDILFTRTGASVGKSYLYKQTDGNLFFAGFLIKFSIVNANPYFVYAHTFKDSYNCWVQTVSMRSGQPGINAEEYRTLKITFPTLPEQQKIAAFLTAVDEKIQQLTKKKNSLEQYKKGVMQKIFLQEIRFKDDNGNDFADWEEKKLDSFLIPTLREIDKPNKPYLAIGIRSHCKGTFQKPDSEPEKIAMEKLFVVKENDLVVNITFAWEGAIAIVKKDDDGGLVSHRFPTYTFKQNASSHKFFQYVFTQKKFRKTLDLISPGGAGRNRVLSKKDFLKIKVLLPTFSEQEKIANFLSAINNKINLINQQLEKSKEYKKGLLQKMFI